MIELASRWWCRTFHRKVMRPVRGHYRCAECFREWPVHWDDHVATAPVPSQTVPVPAQ